MCSLRFENNLPTIEGVHFASISKKTPLSKLSFAFVSLALPLLGGGEGGGRPLQSASNQSMINGQRLDWGQSPSIIGGTKSVNYMRGWRRRAERKGGDNGVITEIEKIFLAIYGPMIDKAPNVMVWM